MNTGRFSTLAFFLCFLSILFTAGAISLGYQQPSSTWVQILHLEECKPPCWIDIQPGETTVREAQEKIDLNYGDTSIYQIEKHQNYRIVHKPTGYSFMVALETESSNVETSNMVVQNIYFAPDVNKPIFPELFNNFGVPDAVNLSSGIDKPRLTITFNSQKVSVIVEDFECKKPLFYQHITQMTFYYELPSNYTWLSEPQKWQGFRPCYEFEW